MRTPWLYHTLNNRRKRAKLASDDFSIPGLGSTMIRAEASPRGDMTNGSVFMQEPAAVRDALHDIVVQNAKLRQEAAHGGLDLAGIEERVDAVLTDEVRAAFMQTLQNARDEMDKARELDRSAEEFLQTVLVDEAALLKSPGGSTPPTAPKAMRQQPSGQIDVLLSPTRTRLRRSPSLQSNGSYAPPRRSPSRHRSPEYERERRYREHSREQPRRDHSKDRYRSLDRDGIAREKRSVREIVKRTVSFSRER
ncbi:hypothetical protein CPB85DRAFT_220526 [Mucidula mucida]|nr:hypothetical protein CPB85DRAFT_220526 [Mucidula mucida]